MKKVNTAEMRAVNGGVMYITKCGGYKFKDTPWGYAKAKLHYAFCSQCQVYNKTTGWWLRFA